MVLAEWDGTKFVNVKPPTLTQSANCVIVTDRGDWSGFITWGECQKRMASMEASMAGKRAAGYFWVEQR